MDIAIIGIGLRMPEANTLSEFRENLTLGKDSVREISIKRRRSTGLSLKEDYQLLGYLEDIDLFDAPFFGISRTEARNMAPEQRILMEIAYETFENAGYNCEYFNNSRTSVYIGDTLLQYYELANEVEPTLYTGNMNSIMAGRIARFFNLRQKAVMIDTTCSSSLVALHQACCDLAVKECDYALVGGVSLNLFPRKKVTKDHLGILSPGGKARSFSAQADGTSAGEAGVCVLLKPLEAALADNDIVHAVIKGTAVNQDANLSGSLTAPSSIAQAEVIVEAWKNARITPADITYIEAHGTGTRLGDPIEIEGITRAFRQFTAKKNFCAVSAVKSNIGHTDCAAGLAGVIKAVLSLKEKQLFPSLHFREPNPFIDFVDSPVYVNDKLRNWELPEDCDSRIACVSSFGLSGTNCHAVLTEIPAACNGNGQMYDASVAYPIFLSAYSASSLKRNIKALLDHLVNRQEHSVEDVSYTTVVGRKHHKHRLAVWASSVDELKLMLQSAAGAESAYCSPVPHEKRIFVCSDWSEAYVGLVQAYCRHPLFMEHYKRCEELAGDNLSQVSVQQFAFQYSLGKLIEQVGVKVDTVLGGNIGKIVISALTAAMPLEVAIHAVLGQRGGEKAELKEHTAALLRKFAEERILFVEMGPLTGISAQMLELCGTSGLHRVMELSPARQLSPLSFLAPLFQCYFDMNMAHAWPLKSSRRIELPAYQFDRERYWLGEELHFDKIKEWCYAFKWVEETAAPDNELMAPQQLLLVSSGSSLLANALNEGFAIRQINCHKLHLCDQEDHIAALNDMKRAGIKLDGIVFLIDPPEAGCPLSERLERELHDIAVRLSVLQGCHELLSTKGFLLTMITVNACRVLPGESFDPSRQMYISMLKGMQAEYPWVTFHSIDLEGGDKDSPAYIINELFDIKESIRYCAYRAGRRYVARLNREETMWPGNEQAEWLPDEGTYIVTGGATGIGLAISQSIARTKRSTFIILGRSILPQKRHWKNILLNNGVAPAIYDRIEGLTTLEQLGAKVEYHAVDLSDRTALKVVLDGVKNRFREIDGIIHSAGIAIESIPFKDLTASSFDQALLAKVKGTLWLDEQVSELEPRFFVLFSSLNALVPKKHSTAYAMANTFEDAYAVFRSAESRTRYVSINWPGWQLKEPQTEERSAAVLRAISRNEGSSCFFYALQLNAPNIAIIPMDLSLFAVNPYFLTEKALGQVTELITIAAEALSPTESKMLTIWREALKSDSIGIEDDFFEVGGHSLVGIQIVNRIEKELGIAVEFELFFDYYTVKSLAEYIDSLVSESTENVVGFEQIRPVEEQEHYAVSFAQKRLWILDFLVEGNVYNIPTAYVLNGELNVTALQSAFDTLIRRHESLRTVLLVVDGVPRQRVLAPDAAGFNIKFIDLTKEADRYEEAARLVEKMIRTRFDLFKGPIVLAQLIQLETTRFIFSFTLHHIISDGWSSEIIVKELLLAYNEYRSGQQLSLPSLTIQYKDYTSWQQKQAEKEAFQEHRKYWLQQFSGEIPVLEFPTDKPRPSVQTFRGQTLLFNFDGTIQRKIKEIGARQDATTFMTLFSVLGILLHKYTGQNDIIVGATVTERGHYDLENQVGFYVNTLPLKAGINPAATFFDVLDHVKKLVADANKHKDFPLELLIDELNLSRDAGRSALFDVMAVYQHVNNPGQQLRMDGIEVDDYHLDTDISRFDLTFDFYESDTDIILKLVFNSALYAEDSVRRIGAHLRQILHSCLDNPLREISSVHLFDAAEDERFLANVHEAMLADRAYVRTSTLVGRWEESVLLYGERDALNYESRLWSYGALNSKVNQLAHYLRSVCGVGPDDLVGLLLEKSDYTVLGILGILKAGGAYVPVDISHPSERIQYILGDALPKVVITQSDHISRLGDYEGHVFVIDLELDLLETSAEDPDHVSKGSDLACCIYTSGTTGKPKGSLIEHHSLVNLTDGLDRLLALESDRPLRMAAIAPVVFDPFGKQLFLALLKGHSLYIVPDPLKQSIGGVWDYYRRHQIQLTDGTPSFLQLLLNYYDGGVVPLDYWLIGGEVFPARLAHMLRALYKEGGREPVLLNEYGLTECTVDNSCYKVDFSVQAENGNLPIGRPLPHNDIFLLDEELRPVAAGVTGEICISGAGLGRGYLNGVELTEEKFVEVSHLQGLKVFRTGDLGRELLSKEIVCLGRKDRQVKIRGNRVELGEIEQVLLRQDGVKEVYVTDREELNGERCLVAYVVLSGGYTQLDLRSYLEGLLPAYMLPSYWLLLESLPLTINGKVDKSSLPDPLQGGSGVEEYVAPVSDLEKKLCEIWSEVLLRERISIRDNFFDIGGHSLKAVQVVFRLQRELQADINVTTIFRNPTIEKLAPEIESLLQTINVRKDPYELNGVLLEEQKELNMAALYTSLPLIEEQEYYNLSYAQRGIWIRHQLEEGLNAYNMSAAYVFEGDLDRDALQKTFSCLIQRHEILRTVFIEVNGEPKQQVYKEDQSSFAIEYSDLREKSDWTDTVNSLAAEEVNIPFDLGCFPLLRAKLLQVEDDKYVFLFTVHHVAVDGWSLELLIKEITTNYKSFKEGGYVQQEQLPVHYRDFCAWQRSMFDKKSNPDELYWEVQLKNEVPALALPYDFPRPKIKTTNSDALKMDIPDEQAGRVMQYCREHDLTLYAFLLASVKVLLHCYSGETDIAVGMADAGRRHVDLESQIGLYLNMLVLRDALDGEDTLLSVSAKVNRTLLNTLEHKDYPFELLVKKFGKQRDISRNPFFDVEVAFINFSQVVANEKPELDGIGISLWNVESTTGGKYDLDFLFNQRGEEMDLLLYFNTDLFKKETVQGILEDLRTVIRLMLEFPDRMLNSVKGALSAFKEEGAVVAVKDQKSIRRERLARIKDGFK